MMSYSKQKQKLQTISDSSTPDSPSLDRQSALTANLNNQLTELSEEEIILLLNYRLANENTRKIIQELIENK